MKKWTISALTIFSFWATVLTANASNKACFYVNQPDFNTVTVISDSLIALSLVKNGAVSNMIDFAVELTSRARCLDCNEDVFKVLGSTMYKEIRFSGKMDSYNHIEKGQITLVGRARSIKMSYSSTDCR